MNVVATDGRQAAERSELSVDLDALSELAERVLEAEGATGELSLTLVGEQTIATLKRDHLDGDGSPTDVLAFPIDGGDPTGLGAEGADTGPQVLLGDVVVCPAVAAGQATGPVADELALLVVHGVLHVLGWDHADEDSTRDMRARERKLLADRTRVSRP